MTAGAKLGPYEIIERIGAGGMGEVFRARDPRLGRDVAIKVSAERFSERFEREARAVAALNHPNICTLYDVGPNYLVMEYIEGEAPKGPLPLDEAIRIARQIADALEAAHEKGIVHRDLKPANIKIKPDGAVKVLDFGLAKTAGVAGSTSADSPTFTMAATQAGVILGTAAYMSPEQTRGKPVDKRADIWAFGAVLYELLTGERLFDGDTVSDTLAGVLTKEPEWDRVPAEVRPVLQSCLQKDPNNRLRDIGDMGLLLQKEQVAAPGRRWLAWAAAAGMGAFAAAFSLVHFREAAPPAPAPVRFQIPLPEKKRFAGYLALSPDGHKAAFAALDNSGNGGQLWVRSLDTLDSRLVARYGSGANAFPFWSPDSHYLAWFNDGKLLKLDPSGGPVEHICDVTDGVLGGSWSPSGVIILGSVHTGLFQVPAAGGVATPLTSLDASRQEMAHPFPAFLPDGRHFIYLRSTADGQGALYAGSLDDPPGRTPKKLLNSHLFYTLYSPGLPGAKSDAGYLLFVRDGTLMAQPFDADKLKTVGQPVPVADKVSGNPNGIFSHFSVSGNGALLYSNGASSLRQLTWFDRQGKSQGAVGETGTYWEIAISPDGGSVAMNSGGPGRTDVTVLDFARSVNTRLTFDPGDRAPVWSPDGKQVVFADIAGNLYVKASNGVGNPELLYKSDQPKTPNAWSPDGRFLLFTARDSKTSGDLWVLPMTGERKPIPFAATPAQEGLGAFSPDGRFVAYVSNESRGRPEIYVRSFPDGSGRWQVSKDGGVDPRWRRDGKELIYLTPDGRLISVEVTTTSMFQPGTPRLLFDSPFMHAGAYTANNAYDIDPDGKRFLAVTLVEQTSNAALTVELNWQAGLRK